MMQHITEIIPENMPDWFKKDLADGQIFCRMVERIENKDKEISELKAEVEIWKAERHPLDVRLIKDLELQLEQQKPIELIDQQEAMQLEIAELKEFNKLHESQRLRFIRQIGRLRKGLLYVKEMYGLDEVEEYLNKEVGDE